MLKLQGIYAKTDYLCNYWDIDRDSFIAWNKENGKCQTVRLPITIQMMQKFQRLFSQLPSSYDNTMFWAACCLAFFGFLNVSKFTVPNQQDYDSSTHLSLNDVSVDSRANPRLIRVRIKQSKTDPFRQGTDIYLSITDNSICPYLAWYHTWS